MSAVVELLYTRWLARDTWGRLRFAVEPAAEAARKAPTQPAFLSDRFPRRKHLWHGPPGTYGRNTSGIVRICSTKRCDVTMLSCRVLYSERWRDTTVQPGTPIPSNLEYDTISQSNHPLPALKFHTSQGNSCCGHINGN